MNLFPKFLDRNNVFEKLREGSDESIINVCNSIISFISSGSLRGSQPAMSVDEILMIFLEYITTSTSYYGIKSVLLCIESIAQINKKYEDCVLQTGLVGAIVDLLRTIKHSKYKHKNNDILSTEIGLMIARILSYFTNSDKRSCLIFRLHHGIHYLIAFVESNKNTLLTMNQYNELIKYVVNICYECVAHTEHTAVQLFESNALELCLQFLSNHTEPSSKLVMKQCTHLIYAICRLNPKIHQIFIKTNGFKIIVEYLCKLQAFNTDEAKSNIIKLLRLISILCTDTICAQTMLSNGALSTLYPFILSMSKNEEIKCVAMQLLNNILRYGMKDVIEKQSYELYKFQETHTKIHIKKSVPILSEEMEPIEFPELEPLRTRKNTRQEVLNDVECCPKSIIPFTIQPPSYPWSQLLPSDLNKIKANIETRKKRRKKRHSLPPTFNKSTIRTRRRNSGSFVPSKGLSNARSSSSLLIKNVTKHDDIEHRPSSESLTSLPSVKAHKNRIKERVSSHSFCIESTSNRSNEPYISSEEAKKYVDSNWIKNYYTNTTSSYLDPQTTSLRGDPLCFQPSNLIIKLLYQQIIAKSSSNLTFTPNIVYDRILNQTIHPIIRRKKQNIPTLEFESRFESGNLHRVIQTGAVEYDLLVSSDCNTTRHRQWFYFRVKNMVQNVSYKFNIVNFDKNDSVFNRGCKPTLYSTKRFKETGIGWTRAHTNDSYYYSNAFKNNYQPKFREIEPSSIVIPTSPRSEKKPTFTNFMNINQTKVEQNTNNENNDTKETQNALLSTPQRMIRKKAVSLNHSEKLCTKKSKRKRMLHDECYSEHLSTSLSPKLTKVNNEKKAKSASSSSSVTTVSPSSPSSQEPITRLNYKKIRKKRARLRNRKLFQTEKEKEKEREKLTDIDSMDSNYTNVLRRDHAIGFDILLASTASNKRLIGGRKKRKIPNSNSNITHNIPSIPSIFMRKKEEADSDKKYHYTLTFTIRFPYSNDTCFLSYFYPFSYSDLQGMLNVLTVSPITHSLNMFRRQLLCRSRWGNRIDLLTITNFNSSTNAIRDRPVIILSSRVHPGEVNASWIMKGIIDFLLSKNTVASELRNSFIFKIIPCLNPDGVICGNHRCSLCGVDLNRQYLNPSHVYHPSIFHLKKLVSTIYADVSRKICMAVDIHGHSRMMNVTLYGCSPDADHKNIRNHNKNNKSHKKAKSFASLKLASMDCFLPNYVTDTTDRYKLFAYLLSERAPNMFNYEQCIWNISKQKEGTARVVFWKQFNIQNAFTLESSFCGSNLNYNLKGFHFNIEHYLEIGAKFCGALYDIGSQSNESKLKIQNAIKHLKSMQTQNTDNHRNTKKLRIRKRKHSKM